MTAMIEMHQAPSSLRSAYHWKYQETIVSPIRWRLPVTRHSRRSIKIKEAVSRFFSTLQNSNAVNLKYLSIDIFLASLAKHNQILLGAVHKLRCRGGGALQMIKVLHRGGPGFYYCVPWIWREHTRNIIADHFWQQFSNDHNITQVGGGRGSLRIPKSY